VKVRVKHRIKGVFYRHNNVDKDGGLKCG